MKLNELVKERTELTNKIIELDDFISKNQDVEDKNLLIAQLHTMKMYKNILSIRINNAKHVVHNKCKQRIYLWC